MGRKRKPFIEGSTNVFLRFTNREIMAMLDSLNIEYDLPDLVWDDDTKAQLNIQLKKFIEKNLINN